MNRKRINEIASAHIEARNTGKFDDIPVTSRDELMRHLADGKTFSNVLDQVEIRFCTITSLILARSMSHNTDAYRRQVRKGFNALLGDKQS